MRECASFTLRFQGFKKKKERKRKERKEKKKKKKKRGGERKKSEWGVFRAGKVNGSPRTSQHLAN